MRKTFGLREKSRISNVWTRDSRCRDDSVLRDEMRQNSGHNQQDSSESQKYIFPLWPIGWIYSIAGITRSAIPLQSYREMVVRLSRNESFSAGLKTAFCFTTRCDENSTRILSHDNGSRWSY
jgi:hypothetical protein